MKSEIKKTIYNFCDEVIYTEIDAKRGFAYMLFSDKSSLSFCLSINEKTNKYLRKVNFLDDFAGGKWGICGDGNACFFEKIKEAFGENDDIDEILKTISKKVFKKSFGKTLRYVD